MKKPVQRVSEELLREVVRRILQAVDPEKIILFGSYAYGQPARDSDLDILVIMPSDRPRWQRSGLIREALRGLLIPMDIVVYTPEEVEEWSEVPLAFVSTAVRKGRVLYEKKN